MAWPTYKPIWVDELWLNPQVWWDDSLGRFRKRYMLAERSINDITQAEIGRLLQLAQPDKEAEDGS